MLYFFYLWTGNYENVNTFLLEKKSWRRKQTGTCGKNWGILDMVMAKYPSTVISCFQASVKIVIFPLLQFCRHQHNYEMCVNLILLDTLGSHNWISGWQTKLNLFWRCFRKCCARCWTDGRKKMLTYHSRGRQWTRIFIQKSVIYF